MRIWASSALLALLLGCTVTTTDRSPKEASSADLLARADGLFQSSQYSNAFDLYALAAAAASNEKERARFVEAASQAAHSYALLGRPHDGRPWLMRAEEQATSADARAWTSFLLARGVYERTDGLVESARATFASMYHFAVEKELDDRALQATHMATQVAQPAERLVWAKRGLDVAEANGDPSWIAHQWTTLGWLYEDLARPADALRAFRSARSVVVGKGSTRDELKADWAVAHGLRRNGERGPALDLLRTVLKRAESNYAQSRTPADAQWLAHAQQEMGELAAAAGDSSAAVEWLVESHKRFLEAGIAAASPDALAELEERIAKLKLELN